MTWLGVRRRGSSQESISSNNRACTLNNGSMTKAEPSSAEWIMFVVMVMLFGQVVEARGSIRHLGILSARRLCGLLFGCNDREIF